MPIKDVDFRAILQTLVEFKVEFVVVGGVSAVLQGAYTLTFDLDIVHSREAGNITRLMAALEHLDAYYRDPGGRRLRPKASYLESTGHHLLITRLGPLDVLGAIGENLDYAAILPRTIASNVIPEYQIRLLDLETLIEVKQQAGRDKDKAAIPILIQALKVQLEQHRSSSNDNDDSAEAK